MNRTLPISSRVTILVGHYGSGKTSLACQIAIRLSAEGKKVSICDLDIVNPYFRTSDRREQLEEKGVRVVASRYAGGNIDLPALPRELSVALSERENYTILDVGGDDRGALALGRYAQEILENGNYELWFAVNFFRPRTRTPEAALEALREIETACGVRATALVNNSNLGNETTPGDLLGTIEQIDALSALTGLPVACTAASGRLKDELEGRIIQPLWMEYGEGLEPGKANLWQN